MYKIAKLNIFLKNKITENPFELVEDLLAML